MKENVGIRKIEKIILRWRKRRVLITI